MIGTSTGEQYDSEFDHTIANYQLTPSLHIPAAERPSTAPEKPAGEFKSDLGTQVAQKGGIDRSSFQAELDKNPNLIHKMASMVKGEIGLGNVNNSQVQLETAFNRAQARGHSLGQALLSVAEDPHKGYYARDTYRRQATPAEVEAFKQNVLDPVMKGSNLSDRGYGPMTGNASASVAAHQFAKGTPGYKLGGESYFNEEKGKYLENLKKLPRLQNKAENEAPITPNSGHSGTALNYAEAPKEQTDAFNNLHIDRTKDVPLAASALHKDGKMYGIAIDKDAPKTDLGIPGFDPAHGVYLHEQTELAHMNNLIAAGQDPVEAYREAHDKVATPTETAFVRATAVQNGKDPDSFLDTYKQYWRGVSAVAAAKNMPDRHPDAHTTTHGLDESELGRSFGDKLMHLREAVTGSKQPTKQQLESGEVTPPTFLQSVGKAAGLGMMAMGKAPSLAEISTNAFKGALPKDLTPLQRSRQLGFDTPTFHGSRSGFSGQKVTEGSRLYSTTSPELASEYAASSRGSVLPLLLKTENYHVVDAGGSVWMGKGSGIMEDAIREAIGKGKDGVIIRNIYDEPSGKSQDMPPQDVYISLNKATVRSWFAKFDPTKIHLNDLLASGIAVAVPAGTMLEDKNK